MVSPVQWAIALRRQANGVGLLLAEVDFQKVCKTIILLQCYLPGQEFPSKVKSC